ncbi:MAG: ABC transporter substrate-binding protein [Clostridia bacterium]|nr:ABC transporter substrate-binding protein [Clostridia bacterium]
MKKSSKIFAITTLLLFLISILAGCGGSATSPGSQSEGKSQGAQEKLTKIRVSHQPEFETFLTYRAMQEGLDKANGVEFELVFFDSGMPQIEALPANQWDVGGTGGVPALMAALRYNAYVIGICDDESFANVVMARADDPIMSVKGAIPQYPDIYGSPEQLKGKNILCTTVSSGHYGLSNYLQALGLSDSDVKIMNLEQAQAVAAFDSGQGDLVALWAPFYYTGLQKGWKVVADGDAVNAKIPLVLIANKKFADENPELVVKFLDVYFQKIDEIKEKGTALAGDYKKFLMDWAAMDISLEDAVLDIEKHPVYDLKEQLALMDNSNGPSEVEKWMQGIADFFTAQGTFTKEERDKVLNSGFVTDKFLKMLAKEKGLIP